MPDTARELRGLLAIDEGGLAASWGQGFAVGHKINPPKNLFPRIETGSKN
jgi:hypothetical protein